MINGDTLIAWGFKPGPWFGEALKAANEWDSFGKDSDFIRGAVRALEPKAAPLEEALQLRTSSVPFGVFLDPATDDEIANLQAVVRDMDAVMRTPTLTRGAVMPDACPQGNPPLSIPVGGVVAARDAIHPGFHSADICCSMAISVFKRNDDVGKVLDAAMRVTHFGGRNRPKVVPLSIDAQKVIDSFAANQFLRGLEQIAVNQLATQGDGNHFLFVGVRSSDGRLAVVTHHGSRNVGGQLYKRGMAVAQRHTAIVSPRTPAHNAWLDANSDDGRAYWEALQIVRRWTRLNHFTIHDMLRDEIGNALTDRWWNEHNFVFRRTDGLYYHGKGATPSYNAFSEDDVGCTLIPLNMGQPILVAEHVDNPRTLGFAPHGAGRNLSRKEHVRRLTAEFPSDGRGLSPRDKAAIVERETKGIDVRFYCGEPDISELPSAYKNPTAVREQIERHGLAKVVDTIVPLGTIMAGDTGQFWRKKKASGTEAVE